MQLGQAYEQLGEPQFALDALNDGARLSGGNSKPLALRGHAFARNARAEEVRAVLEILESVARVRYVPPYSTVIVHLGMAEADFWPASLKVCSGA